MKHALVGCALFFCVLTSAALAGGPPWISVELPGDPMSSTSRDAVLLVRAYSCGQPTAAAVTGTAEGMVGGERRTVPLVLDATGATGVYAVRKQWPSEGTWVLAFSTTIGGEASALVTLETASAAPSSESKGAVVRSATVQVVHRRVSAGDVDQVLRAAAAGSRFVLAEAPAPHSSVPLAGAVAVAACSVLGLAFGARRRSNRER
jgi:hypothetical protein